MTNDPHEAFRKSPYDGFAMAMEQRDAALAKAGRHPLIGAAAHMLDEHRTTKYQIQVVDVISSGADDTGDLALVQFYDWIAGSPTNRRLIPLKELATEKWILFINIEEANDYYNNVASHRDKAIRSRLEGGKK